MAVATISPTSAVRSTPREIPQFEPWLDDQEATQLLDCIRTKWLTEGVKSAEFLDQLKAVTGAKRALLAPNGTLALYVALMVRGIGPGDEVIVPDFTFLASASSVALTGATPVFVDVHPGTFNIDPEEVRRALSPRTRAILPVHMYGQAADMDALLEIARAHGLWVIEDAAQGIGVRYKGKVVGTFGDFGCLSFFADKTITTGEGGALLTNDDDLAEKCLYFRNQGRLARGSFIHPHLGYNFRLTDLQAALGIAQIAKLEKIIAAKLAIDQAYRERLAGIEQVQFPEQDTWSTRVPFRISVLVPNPADLGNHLARAGVGVRRYFYPLHRQPCFTSQNSRALPGIRHSVHAFDHGLCLPSAAQLPIADIDYVCARIFDYFRTPN